MLYAVAFTKHKDILWFPIDLFLFHAVADKVVSPLTISSFNLPASLRASNRTQMHSTMSISSSAQYVTLQKYFSFPSLLIHFFPTPLIKLKLGLQKVGDY